MRREVFYLRGRGEEMGELLQALARRGLRAVSVRSLEAVQDGVRQGRGSALIVDASAGDNEVSQRLLELTEAQDLYRLPVLFIGKQAVERARIAAGRFDTFIAVDFPVHVDQLLRRIADALAGGETAKPPERLFPADPAKLDGASFGGDAFALAADVRSFDDAVLTAGHPRRQQLNALLESITRKDHAVGLHARRTAFLSTALGSRDAGIAGSGLALRTTGLLLNSACLEDPAGPKLDPLRNPELRTETASFFRKSAEIVGDLLEDSAAAKTIDNAAALLTGSRPVQTAAEVREALCVLMSELTGRCCWNEGEWDYNGPPRVLHALRKDPLFFDRPLSMALSRALNEAVSVRGIFPAAVWALAPEARMAFRRQRTAAADAARAAAVKDAKAVKLYELQAGMQLSEPLVAGDGQLILDAGTILDFDLLLRIFALASRRHMPQLVLVARDRNRRES